MTTPGVERRVLDVSAPRADYTVTSNATLQAGPGYGVYVRASVDTATKLTAYCVQLDHGYGTGQIVVREILGDAELAVPIAHVAVPAGFAWYGVSHIVEVTVKGNTMKVSLDGARQLSVTDLAAASGLRGQVRVRVSEHARTAHHGRLRHPCVGRQSRQPPADDGRAGRLRGARHPPHEG